jgi:twinkle protein
MARLLKSHLPCLDCGSSDALAEYSDGHTFCFSCGVYTPGEGGLAEQGGWGLKGGDKNKTQQYQGLIKYFPNNERKDLTSFNPSCIIEVSKKEREGISINKRIDKGLSEGSKISNTLSISKEDSKLTMEFVGMRGISVDTMRKYNVKTNVDQGGLPVSIMFPYGKHNAKLRSLKEKQFWWQYKEDELKEHRLPLFGMDMFEPGCAKSITLTEGEFDALAAYQMQGSKYPVVSVSSAGAAENECKQAFKYLNSFDNIYLNFDNDNPGIEATLKVARLFNPNKVFLVPHEREFKDANAYLEAKKQQEYTKLWWSSSTFKPKNIINRNDEIKDIIFRDDQESIATYPFPDLDGKAFGIRSSEVVLITAPEKVGKTEILRAIEHHLLKTTPYNIGVIHLEESERRAVLGLINYEVMKPVHLPHSGVSKQEMYDAYEKMVGKDNRVNYYTHFGSDDPDVILDSIRYMVAVQGCKFLFLDHITMLVTGYEGDDERRKLDYISTRLAMLTRELDFTLFLISHVNDDGKTRGSRNISKIADLILHMERDIEAKEDLTRNTTNLVLKGNRFSGLTGPVNALFFDTGSYTLRELNEEDVLKGAIPF